MDLLQANYASSAEEEEGDDDSATAHGSHKQQQQLRMITEEMERKKLSIAQRFAERAKKATHVPIATSGFAFRPFVAKKRKLDDQAASSKPQEQQLQDLTSLFKPQESTQTKKIESALIRLPSTHSGPVHCVQWNGQARRLFLSASMDSSVHVWRYEEATASSVRVLQHHSKGVKSAKWTLDGRQILSGGFDTLVLQTDLESAAVVQRFEHDQDECITSVCMHPTDPDLMLIGSDNGRIYCRDLRSRADAAVYKSSFADVHDLLFLPEGDRFVSSSGIRTRDASNQTLLVWDARSSTLLFDRLDLDFMAHSCLRLHPFHRYFVAQCSGDYASVYAATAPFKRLYASKNKSRPRVFQGGHQVAGYSIQCSFSAQDGAYLASGDANGRLVVYETSSRSVVAQRQLYRISTPCLAAEFHPQDPELMVTSSYDGQLHIVTQKYGTKTRIT